MFEVARHDLHQKVGVTGLRIAFQDLRRGLDETMKLLVSTFCMRSEADERMSDDSETQFHGIEDGDDTLDILLVTQPFQTACALGRGEIDRQREFVLRQLAVLLESGEQFDIEW